MFESHYLPGYPSAGLGVGEGVVVVLEVEAAGGGDGVELVVPEVGELASRGTQGVEEDVARVVHLVGSEDGAQASLVEGAVVSHQWQPFNHWLNQRPHIGEDGCVVGIVAAQSVYPAAPVVVIVRLGLY